VGERLEVVADALLVPTPRPSSVIFSTIRSSFSMFLANETIVSLDGGRIDRYRVKLP